MATPVEDLRREVRDFVRKELEQGTFTPRCDSWVQGYSPEFSRKLGRRGWLGMTWPTRYGGHDRSSFERFVVLEELVSAGAPVAAHWTADRQTGPLLLRFGTEEQCQRFLPPMARGELFVAIGMSEPDSGSDLASIRTRAERGDGGWRLFGTKVWTSHAHRGHYLVALVRTSPVNDGDRHDGLSQMMVDLSADGIQTNPITTMGGEEHFSEVVLDGAFVPDEMVIGQVGDGWNQVLSELSYERSGPERFLSTFPLISAWAEERADGSHHRLLGSLASHLWALHLLSLGINRKIEAGAELNPAEPALVKDLGTQFEQKSIEMVRSGLPRAAPSDRLRRHLREATLAAPSFTLRGGTNEILRTIIARGFGL